MELSVWNNLFKIFLFFNHTICRLHYRSDFLTSRDVLSSVANCFLPFSKNEGISVLISMSSNITVSHKHYDQHWRHHHPAFHCLILSESVAKICCIICASLLLLSARYGPKSCPVVVTNTMGLMRGLCLFKLYNFLWKENCLLFCYTERYLQLQE